MVLWPPLPSCYDLPFGTALVMSGICKYSPGKWVPFKFPLCPRYGNYPGLFIPFIEFKF